MMTHSFQNEKVATMFAPSIQRTANEVLRRAGSLGQISLSAQRLIDEAILYYMGHTFYVDKVYVLLIEANVPSEIARDLREAISDSISRTVSAVCRDIDISNSDIIYMDYVDAILTVEYEEESCG